MLKRNRVTLGENSSLYYKSKTIVGGSTLDTFSNMLDIGLAPGLSHLHTFMTLSTCRSKFEIGEETC